MAENTPFQKFESLAKHVFSVPKEKVAKAVAADKEKREKRHKAGCFFPQKRYNVFSVGVVV
ncbi:MAG TPA: hypothetical protein VM008_12890 [Phycisphaerae bacterium]|nr:hypothetical protein [Phycisphaerae bacterium]